MRIAGAILSAAGHAGLVALLLQAPWLRPHRAPPPETVAVSLVSEAELAAAVAAVQRGALEPTAPAEDLPAGEASPEAPVEPWPEPEPEAAEADPIEESPPEAVTLAPFDAASPLGLREPGRTPSPATMAAVPPPRARPADLPRAAAPPPAPETGNAGLDARDSDAAAGDAAASAQVAGYEAAVRAAIERAKIYPRAARDRGLEGTSRVSVVIARDGRLLNAQLTRSSGVAILDYASVNAVRRAALPRAPAGSLPERFSFEVSLRYDLTGG